MAVKASPEFLLKSLRRRFSSRIIITERCWEWCGQIASTGYGRIRFGQLHTFAHRVSYSFFFGKIPRGLCVLHKCDNPRCVRPDHLFLGTKKDNTDDAVRKGRMPHGESHKLHKLSAAQVTEIRQRHSSGESRRALRTDFRISKSQVQRIVTAASWRHLPHDAG